MNTIDNLSLKRMESILRIWEQILFVASAELRATLPEAVVGAIKNWRRFRETVLDLSQPFPLGDFQMPQILFRDYFLTFMGYNALPEFVSGWSRSSRRVYSLTLDMQRMLELTAIGHVTWDDLNPPFPYFIVSLPIPILNTQGGALVPNKIDTLLVSLNKERRRIEIFPLGEELESFKLLTPELRRRTGVLVKGGNLAKLQHHFDQLRKGNYCFIPPNAFIEHSCGSQFPIFPDNFNNETINVKAWNEKGTIVMKDEQLEWWRPIFRIVLGLCLHLDLGHESDRAKSKTFVLREHFTHDEKAVTDGADICSVQLEHELSEDERSIHTLFREKGVTGAMKEIGSHFRGGYWRRPPGYGSDPTATKSVRVRWTIVNQRRLPSGALPAGTNTVVG
jgi:hypothetical protein